MNDKISLTTKLMLLMIIKTTRLLPPGGMENDSLRVPVSFPTPYDYTGVVKLTMNAQLRL